MKLKVISNGTTYGTKIIDAETGELIRNVRSIVWSIDAVKSAEKRDSMVTATIVFERVELEVEGEFEEPQQSFRGAPLYDASGNLLFHAKKISPIKTEAPKP